MKPFIVLICMALVGLMPLALAVEASITANSDTSAQAGEETTAESSTSTEVTVSANDKANERKERRQAAKEERKEKREEIKALIKDVASIRKETRETLKEQRQALKEQLSGLKGCRGKKTDDCETKRKEAKVAVIDTMKASADEVTKLLESVKSKVTESSADNKETVIVSIDAQIKAIADAKVKAETLTDSSSSKEDIKDASETLRKAVREAKHSAKLGKHKLFAHKLGGVLERSKNLEERLDRTLKKLKEKGADTGSIDLVAFKAKLEAAREAHVAAVNLFEKARTADPEQKDELMKQVTDELRESHKLLKEAHALLKGIVAELKTLKGGSEALASTKTEASATVKAEASQG